MSRLKISNPSGAYVYRKGSLAGPSLDRIGRWDSEDGQNYAACASCGRINHFNNDVGNIINFTRDKLYSDVQSCIVCTGCEAHFFISLASEDWPIDLSEAQHKFIRTMRRTLGKMLSYGAVPGTMGGQWAWRAPAYAYSRTGWIGSVYVGGAKGVTMSIHTGNGGFVHFPDLDSATKALVENYREHEKEYTKAYVPRRSRG